MRRLTVRSTIAALAALLLFAIPAQADEIDPEPAMEAEPEPETEDEPESEMEDEPEPEPQRERSRHDDYARNGAYLIGNMAGAWYTELKQDTKDALEALGYSLGLDLESPLGLGVRGGYRFHPHLAAEAQLGWFAKATIEAANEDDPASDLVKIKTLTVTGNLKAYLLTGRIQPYLLAGAGLMRSDVDDKLAFDIYDSESAFAARFGGGLDLYLNRNLAILMEGNYVLPTGALDGLDHVLWAVGLQYRF